MDPQIAQKSDSGPLGPPWAAKVRPGASKNPLVICVDPFWNHFEIQSGPNLLYAASFLDASVAYVPKLCQTTPQRSLFATKPPRFEHKGPAAWGRSPLDNKKTRKFHWVAPPPKEQSAEIH